MCRARRRGRSAAALPAGNAAPQPSSPGPIQPVRSSRHAYHLDAKHAEALKPSILILITPTLFQVFVKLPCPCQAHCPGNPVWCYVNIRVNIYNEYSDKYSCKFLQWIFVMKMEIFISPKRIFKKIFMFWEIFFWIFNNNLNIMNIY